MKTISLFLTLYLTIFSVHASEPCNSILAKPSLCSCSINQLHPTQISVGMREVNEKEKEIANLKVNPIKLDKFLAKNPEPIVIGPNGIIFIVDHHHLARSLYDQEIDSTYCRVIDNFSNLNEAEFWIQMEKNHLVYPYDENGNGPLPYTFLPTSVDALKDDPFRSLAKYVRDRGGYDRSEEYFVEFKWANFFRPRINIGSSDADFENAITKGLDLAVSPEAQGLPGYHGK